MLYVLCFVSDPHEFRHMYTHNVLELAPQLRMRLAPRMIDALIILCIIRAKITSAAHGLHIQIMRLTTGWPTQNLLTTTLSGVLTFGGS